MKRFLVLMIALLIISGGLFASGGSQGRGSTDGVVEVKFWGESDKADIHDIIVAEFNRRNPGIRASFDSFADTQDFRDLIRPAINSGSGPDVYNYDTGPGYLGMMVRSGLALDLTSYVQKYNLRSRFMPGSFEITTYGDKIYGLPHELEMLGVYYNKKMFADHGLAVPRNSYQEFLDVCQKFLNAGITPVLLDDLGQWPFFHYESVWMNSFAGPQKVKDAIDRKIKWTDPDLILAMDRFSEFTRSNFVNKQINSLDYDDANAMFVAGQYPMRITGTWKVNDFYQKMGDNIGIFTLPPGSSRVPKAPASGFGGCQVANARAKNPDAVAAFMDFYFSDFACKAWYEGNYIPSVKGFNYSAIQMIPLFKNVVDELFASNQLGVNIDVLTGPRVNDAALNYGQQLIDGSINGTRAMEAKQRAHEADFAAGDY